MAKSSVIFVGLIICAVVPRSASIPPSRLASLEQNPSSFSRSCSRSQDCEFENRIVRDTVYLSCTRGACSCERFPYIADVPAWDLEWNAERQDCRIALGGPCGPSKGLKISCQAGLECLEGRCRDASKLRQNPKDYSCNESLDCQQGLVCKVTSFYFSAQKTCVTPETKALEGFEDY